MYVNNDIRFSFMNDLQMCFQISKVDGFWLYHVELGTEIVLAINSHSSCNQYTNGEG